MQSYSPQLVLTLLKSKECPLIRFLVTQLFNSRIEVVSRESLVEKVRLMWPWISAILLYRDFDVVNSRSSFSIIFKILPCISPTPQHNVLPVFGKLLCTWIHELTLAILKVLILYKSQRFIYICYHNPRAFVHDAQNSSSSLIPEAFLYSRTITYHPLLSFDQAVHCVARSRGCHYPYHVLLLRAQIEVKVRLQIFRSSLRKERFLRKEITLRSRRATKLKFRSRFFLLTSGLLLCASLRDWNV
jgi:hypothetical protein